MRYLIQTACIVLALAACDPYRIYDKNSDFQNGNWPVSEKPEFEFHINNTETAYNLYVNVRNAISYPKSNLYFSYQLRDSIGTVIQDSLVSEMIFDLKTGKPFGSSVLGDVYNHRFVLLQNFSFPHAGRYSVQFEQFSREDSLQGMLSIGLRVEQNP